MINFQPYHNDLNRLMAAAVIDRDFCKLLLSNPVRAIGQGYYGEHFQLPVETQSHLGSISATSLSEFAQKIIAPVEGKQNARRRILPRNNVQTNDQNRYLHDSSA